MRVSVLPYEFEFREHLYLWKKYKSRGELIDWQLARDYFRKTPRPAYACYIDARVDLPILQGWEPL